MDVVLVNYGHCNFVSPKHASIFYDEVICLFIMHYVCKIILHSALPYLYKWKPSLYCIFSLSQFVIAFSVVKLI